MDFSGISPRPPLSTYSSVISHSYISPVSASNFLPLCLKLSYLFTATFLCFVFDLSILHLGDPKVIGTLQFGKLTSPNIYLMVYLLKAATETFVICRRTNN